MGEKIFYNVKEKASITFVLHLFLSDSDFKK